MDAHTPTSDRSSQHPLHDIAIKGQISNISPDIAGKSDTEEQVRIQEEK
jgi:hypothetical protein